MTLTVSITEDDVYAALGAFLESVLPAGVVVIQLPSNRVSMPPPAPGFVGMTSRQQARIMTNLDDWDPTDVNPVAIEITQAVKLEVTLNCYGADSPNWAVILSTVLRDEYGCDGLAPLLSPLYCDAPMFAPLIDGEEEYENRWIVKAYLQYNPVISTPMQFADTAEVGLKDVDVVYPP